MAFVKLEVALVVDGAVLLVVASRAVRPNGKCPVLPSTRAIAVVVASRAAVAIVGSQTLELQDVTDEGLE
jgi:hypothetical protein